MGRSKVVIIALKRLSVPAHRLCSSLVATTTTTASAAARFPACILQPHISPIPLLGLFFSSWDFFPFLHPKQSQLCRKKGSCTQIPHPAAACALCNYTLWSWRSSCLHAFFFFLPLKLFWILRNSRLVVPTAECHGNDCCDLEQTLRATNLCDEFSFLFFF